MRPVVFDGCFGWLHPAAGSRGVVLCAPHGYEELCVHRQLAGLAERIAATGLPTLRFDYRGTGDSLGNDEEPQRLRAWIDSVRDAVRFMRRELGVAEITLVGVRLGGTLAALAARELRDIDGLALLAPVESGRIYAREMKVLEAFSLQVENAPAPAPQHANDIEAAGFVLTEETVAALRQVDLRQLDRAPARRVLLLDPAAHGESGLADRLRDLGADVEVAPFEGFDRFICEVHYGQRTPEAAFGTLIDWLGRDAPAPAEARRPRVVARLEGPHAIETPVFFGPGARLVGTTCEPRPAAADRDAPAVLFVNTGHHHRIGVNRMAVDMGRRLAARGITSMRIDVTGLGDSPASAGRPENEVYDKRACGDVRAAIDCLEAQGHRDVVLIGLCSGAYVSFYTALEDTRVVSQVLINMQKFVWRKGDSLATAVRTGSKRASDLGGDVLAAFGKTDRLLGLLKGGRREWHAVWALLHRACEWTGSAVGHATHALFGIEGEVARSFRLLGDLGTDTLLVYSVGDPGLVELELHRLRRSGEGIDGLRRVRVEMIDGADHTLSLRPSRERLAAILEAHLKARPPAVEAPAPALRPAATVRPIRAA
ncbi:MAG TPA: alpha/beta hydrolase [Vineibacter sp.]|nr:alpha/beta hydrolase [Vineibacter sp.]